MPIYEYVCDQCGRDLEALQKITEEPLVYCPECGEAALRKKVSAAAFRLKGTGWYETDFKDSGKEKKKEPGKDSSDRSAGQKSGKEKAASSGDTKSDSNSKTETSSDSKSETKPAANGGGSDSAGGSSKPSSGASQGSD
jgi:putative FmdB family regulatory protein